MIHSLVLNKPFYFVVSRHCNITIPSNVGPVQLSTVHRWSFSFLLSNLQLSVHDLLIVSCPLHFSKIVFFKQYIDMFVYIWGHVNILNSSSPHVFFLECSPLDKYRVIPPPPPPPPSITLIFLFVRFSFSRRLREIGWTKVSQTILACKTKRSERPVIVGVWTWCHVLMMGIWGWREGEGGSTAKQHIIQEPLLPLSLSLSLQCNVIFFQRAHHHLFSLSDIILYIDTQAFGQTLCF